MADGESRGGAAVAEGIVVLDAPQVLDDAGRGVVLAPEVLEFVAELARRFTARRDGLLSRRDERQAQFDAGATPDFLAATRGVRESDWKVAPIPPDLLDRRVEITGPPERKMIVNALNSGARVYMADFEDSNSPTWRNCVEGQANLHDAIRRKIDFTAANGKRYALAERTATLMVRPRGWHLDERHLVVDGRPVPAALFDFGVYFFLNARELLARGTGPYFYLPKLESHLEARLWNDVFLFAQDALGVPRGTIRATVLVETLPAAFEMDEILFELREHSAGLNCGRWDYIFSFIKKLRNRPDCVLPDRAQVTMTTHFLRSYSLLLIRTCHRRGVHAMGGMAAQIPIKDDPIAGERALAKVRADKEREAGDGHDGTWVAHPGLVPVAAEVFDRLMPGPNQIGRLREDVAVTAQDLLRVPTGRITRDGLRTNVSVGLRYLEAWLRGSGCVPINQLMEDAATAEICRAQLWQWVRHDGVLDDGTRIAAEVVGDALVREIGVLSAELGAEPFAAARVALAGHLFAEVALPPDFADFLTAAAYGHLQERK